MNGAPFYVMEFVDGPDPALAHGGRGELRRGRAARDRRARRRHAGRDPRDRPRPGRPRRPGPQGGLRRQAAPPLARPVGEVEDPRAAADRRRPPPARGADPRAGPGDDRPRRLPARQHDPQRGGRGRGGRRLGALHARRPARRRRHAARLLVRARRRADAALRGPRPPRPASRRATRSGTATRALSGRDVSGIDFYVALPGGSSAIILQGVYARYAAGQYGEPDEGIRAVRQDRRAPRGGGRRGRAPAGLGGLHSSHEADQGRADLA